MSEPMVDVPEEFTVAQLRDEIARLNDERVTLAVQLEFANQTIGVLQAELRVMAIVEKNVEGDVVSPAATVPESPDITS